MVEHKKMHTNKIFVSIHLYDMSAFIVNKRLFKVFNRNRKATTKQNHPTVYARRAICCGGYNDTSTVNDSMPICERMFI